MDNFTHINASVCILSPSYRSAEINNVLDIFTGIFINGTCQNCNRRYAISHNYVAIRFDYGSDLIIINFIWPIWTLLILEWKIPRTEFIKPTSTLSKQFFLWKKERFHSVQLSWWVIHYSNYRHNRLKWFRKVLYIVRHCLSFEAPSPCTSRNFLAARAAIFPLRK